MCVRLPRQAGHGTGQKNRGGVDARPTTAGARLGAGVSSGTATRLTDYLFPFQQEFIAADYALIVTHLAEDRHVAILKRRDEWGFGGLTARFWPEPAKSGS